MTAPTRTRYSLAVPVCCFFAANPEEELSTSDIRDKFTAIVGSDLQSVSVGLRGLVAAGYLLVARSASDDRINVYSAGPRLLKSIGRAA